VFGFFSRFLYKNHQCLESDPASGERNDKALVTQNVLITGKHWHNLQSYFSTKSPPDAYEAVIDHYLDHRARTTDRAIDGAEAAVRRPQPIAWHSAQTCCANAMPFCGSPTACA
jgi:hypothetical protein